MKCPVCKSDVDPHSSQQPDSPYPFCSDRCKLIDLGRWLSNKYQIPITEDDDSSPPPDMDAPVDDDDI